MKYRKKPIVVEAMRILDYSEQNLSPIVEWSNGKVYPISGHVHVETLEGTLAAYAGDWIIKGVKGEFYPCKPDIFEETYEADEDTEYSEPTDINPYLLTGEELKRTEEARRRGIK